MNFAIKSKLVLIIFFICFINLKEGEVGRMDTEQARELNKINIEFKKVINNLADID